MRVAATLSLVVLSNLWIVGTASSQSRFIEKPDAAQILASHFMAQTVYDSNDMRIGAVNDLILDPSTGAIEGLVIGVGGFLGVAEKSVAVSFSAVKPILRDGKSWLRVEASKREFDEAPPFIPLAPARDASTPAASAPPTSSGLDSDLSPGANSFTELQARWRIEAHGFTNVHDLRKDENSIWRGVATRDGATRSVALDYRGNVDAR